MRIIPVLDLMNGEVVRAIAGRRHEYKPLRSSLTNSTEPLSVARAIREHFEFTELYFADLDAIAGRPVSLAVISSLQTDGFDLLVDAGLRNGADANALLESGAFGIVAGLETINGPDVVVELLNQLTASRLVFSLDLKNGVPLTSVAAAWQTSDPVNIVRQAVAMGIRRFLVLDLSRVGCATGTGTESLCSQIRLQSPDIELLAGGGIRGHEDILRLQSCGVNGVLIASALHDGSLRRGDLN